MSIANRQELPTIGPNGSDDSSSQPGISRRSFVIGSLSGAIAGILGSRFIVNQQDQDLAQRVDRVASQKEDYIQATATALQGKPETELIKEGVPAQVLDSTVGLVIYSDEMLMNGSGTTFLYWDKARKSNYLLIFTAGHVMANMQGKVNRATFFRSPPLEGDLVWQNTQQFGAAHRYEELF